MSNNNSNSCSRCKKDKCRCKKPKDICYEDGCEIKVPAECVIYEPKGGVSFLRCYLGLDTKTNLKEILEVLDHKLCNAFTLQINSCTASMLNLNSTEVDYKVLLNRLTEYICTQSDKYVRVSPNDTQSGYLNDKIVLGKCLNKIIRRDSNNVETLEISLDFNCLQNELSLTSCIEIDCCGSGGPSPSITITSNTTSLCGSNSVTFTAATSSSCHLIEWYRNNILVSSNANVYYSTTQAGTYYAICKNSSGQNVNISNNITIIHSGPCICSDTIWTDTGEGRCFEGVSQKEQRSNCDNYRWVSGGSNCSEIIWTPAIPLNIRCGSYLNNITGTTNYDNCLLYELQVNNIDEQTRWMLYLGSGEPELCSGCGGEPEICDIFSCNTTTSLQNIEILNNCGEIVANYNISNPVPTCNEALESNKGIVTIPTTITGGNSEFRLRYAIISGPVTRGYQTSNSFINLPNGNYVVAIMVDQPGKSLECLRTKAVTVNCNITPCAPVWNPGSEYCNGVDRYRTEVNSCTGETRQVLVQANSSLCQGPCVPTGPRTCTSSGDVLTIRDSCGVFEYSYTLSSISTGCHGSGVRYIDAHVSTINGNNLTREVQIISGPITRPPQVGTRFDDIPIGNYVIRMTSTVNSSCYVEKSINITENCPSECNDEDGVLVVTTDKIEICVDNSTALLVTATTHEHCGPITWMYSNSPNAGTGTESELGVGGSNFTVSNAQQGYYFARCYNCNGGYESNRVFVTRTEDCSPCVPYWLEDPQTERCIGNDRYITEYEWCGLEQTGNERAKLLEENSDLCLPDTTYYKVILCSTQGELYTIHNLSGIDAGDIVLIGGIRFQYDGTNIVTNSAPPNLATGDIEFTSDTECDPNPCTDPNPSISITSSANEICPGDTITFESSSNVCTQINWYRANFSTPTAWEFFAMDGGGTITTTQNGRYQAQCVNCNGSSLSNIIEITDGECGEPELLWGRITMCQPDLPGNYHGSGYVPGGISDRIPGQEINFGSTLDSQAVFEGNITSTESALDGEIEIRPYTLSELMNCGNVIQGHWRNDARIGPPNGYWINYISLAGFQHLPIGPNGAEIFYEYSGRAPVRLSLITPSSLPQYIEISKDIELNYSIPVRIIIRDYDWATMEDDPIYADFTIPIVDSSPGFPPVHVGSGNF